MADRLTRIAIVSSDRCKPKNVAKSVRRAVLWSRQENNVVDYFTRFLEDNLKAIIKPQYVDHIPKAVQGNVVEVLDQKDERDKKAELCADLELNQVIE